MTDSDAPTARNKLLQAQEDLLEGRVPGPLTGVRLVEVADVKRHRLTHDNPDIAATFKKRAAELNRSQPEVDRLRSQLQAESKRAHRLVTENIALATTVRSYAEAILALIDERNRLQQSLNHRNVSPLPNRRGGGT